MVLYYVEHVAVPTSSELDVSFRLFSCVMRQRSPDSGTFFNQIFTVTKETYLPNWAGFAITGFLPDALSFNQ